MQPELIASGTLFARIFHASPVAMAIYARADGRCVAVNDAFTRLFGYDAETLIGRRAQDLGFLDDDNYRLLGTTVLNAGRLADRPLRVRARDNAGAISPWAEGPGNAIAVDASAPFITPRTWLPVLPAID